jgi:hypothetical protein
VSKAEKAQTDPRRAELAEAIRERDEFERIAGAARVALDRANDLVEAASTHAEAVQIALSSARDGREKRLRQAVEGGDVIEAAVSRREARFAEIDAADELETARKVSIGCRSALAEAEADADRAQRRVEAASLPVLAGEVDRLLAEAAAIHETLEAKLAAVDFVNAFLIPGSPERTRIALTRPPLPPGVMPADRRGHPALAAWREARQQLFVNADAALPT